MQIEMVKNAGGVRRSKEVIKSGAYISWAQMKSRCNNPNVPEFKNYGGRGIKVCERWNSFDNFYEDMGERPKGKSIDRINVNGNYEPKNCKWSTGYEQRNNTTRTRSVCVNGLTMSIKQWSDFSGIAAECIRSRLNRGWTDEEAINGKNA